MTATASARSRSLASGQASGGNLFFSPYSKGLYLGAVVHKAFVEVNEEGTEAAATTGGVIRPMSARIEPPPAVFRADKPFMFAISDVKTGRFLFLGRIMDPTK